jgi:DNA-binding sugar fermentation-stimulating protein
MEYKTNFELTCLKVLKRPSASIKSPYVADVILLEDSSDEIIDDCEDETKPKYLLHTPGLGCGGLVIHQKYVYAYKSSPSSKTDYTTFMAYCEDSEGIYYIGLHPMISQKVSQVYLEKKYPTVKWKTEVSLSKETRIDYVGITQEKKKIYVEVKNGMVSYEEHKPRSERRALFPECSKKTTKPVSERALKHALTLQSLLEKEDTQSCILLYTIPREDCKKGIVINKNDSVYHKTICEVKEAGVELQSIGMMFDLSGVIKHIEELNVYLE